MTESCFAILASPASLSAWRACLSALSVDMLDFHDRAIGFRWLGACRPASLDEVHAFVLVEFVAALVLEEDFLAHRGWLGLWIVLSSVIKNMFGV